METASYLLYNLSFATVSKSNNSGNVRLSSEKFSPHGDVRIHKVSSSIRAEDAEKSDGRGLMLSTLIEPWIIPAPLDRKRMGPHSKKQISGTRKTAR